MAYFDTDENEISYWEKQYQICDKQRKAYEEAWYMNLAFYFSKQWVVWNRTINGSARLYDPPSPRNRVRLISNRVKPVIRDELTKLIKEEPQFYVVPNTTDPTDVAAARVAESLAEFILKNTKYNRIRRQTTFWALICGTSYVKTTCPGIDEDIINDKITAFNIFVPDLENEDIQTQAFVMHCRGVPADSIEQQYGEKVPTDMSVNGASLEQKFLSAIGVKNKDASDNKMVYVKEIWVKPCLRYKQGALITIANKKIVYRYTPDGTQFDENNDPIKGDNGFPYDHGQYPFAKMDHTASGRYYGTSTIEDIIPLQKEYNKSRSQIIESKNRMAKPQMTYVKGSIDVTKITSEVGLYIPVMPGFDPPRPIALAPLPEYALQIPNMIKEDIDEVAGRNDISRGGVPTGIQAASAIAYLAEQNDSKIYNTVISIEEATEQIGQQVLSLVQQFWTPEKIEKIVSRNNAFEASVFMISSLNKNTDLRVEAGSMAPKSKAAQQAFITDLMTKGMIPPEKGLRYLQMNETNRLYDELQVDSRQAQRENFKMAQGDTSIQPNDFDNDPVHIYEHELYMKSQEYEALDDQGKSIFINHLTMTKQKVLNVGLQQSGQPGSGGNSPIPGQSSNGQIPVGANG